MSNQLLLGYGNLFTKTVWGRVTTIIYSAIGIPITLATLSDLGKFLSRLLKRLWHKTVACCAKLKRRAATTDDDNESLKSAYLDSFDFPISVAVIILFVWSIGCAEVFRWWETDWSHFYSIYFYFISVTTIGLGDITPSQPHLYLLNFGLIMVGMTFISMLFSLVSEKLSYWSDKTSCKLSLFQVSVSITFKLSF